MQYIFLVKVRHTLRDLVNHFQCVDACGISIAQAFQVLNEASPWIILADLFERRMFQTNRERVTKQSGRRGPLTRNHGGSPLALEAPKSSSTFEW
jgi:hypothetical protein